MQRTYLSPAWPCRAIVHSVLLPLQRGHYHPVVDKYYDRVAGIYSGQTLVVLKPKEPSLTLTAGAGLFDVDPMKRL